MPWTRCGGAPACEPLAVSAFHTHFTDGYEWPTSIVVNLQLEGDALGHVTSSTDFMMPYVFSVELMGDRATLRQDLIQWLDEPLTVDELTAANPVDGVRFEAATDGSGRPAIRIRTTMPDSADVSHHPFQDEIDDLVESILDPRKRRRSTCSTPRKRWRSAWQRIDRQSSAGNPSSCR